jgi:hypothetical protein
MQRAEVNLPPMLPPDTMDMMMQVSAHTTTASATTFNESSSESSLRLTPSGLLQCCHTCMIVCLGACRRLSLCCIGRAALKIHIQKSDFLLLSAYVLCERCVADANAGQCGMGGGDINSFCMCADESNRREALAAGALTVIVM